MTRSWLADVTEACGTGIVRAVVVAAAGSTPREVGAAMLITARTSTGTIGGGALEHDVIHRARAMIAAAAGTAWVRDVQRYHLGPDLDQCCGGAVRVMLEHYGRSEQPHLQVLVDNDPAFVQRPLMSGVALQIATPAGAGVRAGCDMQTWLVEATRAARTPLIVYGAGHVGRAVVMAAASLPFDITWVDIAADRFADLTDIGCACVVAAEPARWVAERAASASGAGGFHLVMTHSHDLDEVVVAAVLRHAQVDYLGLIGSATKAARFRQRLARCGLAETEIARLVCPIGLPGLPGKEPAIIAASVVADLLLRRAALTAPHPVTPAARA